MCIRDRVWTPPPVQEASSPKVIPAGVMPLYSRFTTMKPLDIGSMPVSYTHLDVYKRQALFIFFCRVSVMVASRS